METERDRDGGLGIRNVFGINENFCLNWTENGSVGWTDSADFSQTVCFVEEFYEGDLDVLDGECKWGDPRVERGV